MSARADLCGGRSAMIVPTATSSSVAGRQIFAPTIPVGSPPTPSYPKTGVMSGSATTLPEHISTRVQKQPSQINPKRAVHEA